MHVINIFLSATFNLVLNVEKYLDRKNLNGYLAENLPIWKIVKYPFIEVACSVFNSP